MDAIDISEHESRDGQPLFNLGQTVLLFLPGIEAETAAGAEADHKVAQVTLETSGDTRAKTKVETIAAFFLVQHEVSELIIRVVRAHEAAPLPRTPVRFVGDRRYVLVAETKAWAYGATLRLAWGGARVRACAEKWTFRFELIE
ncbi:hypothetical protein DFH11DRAFT_1632325 [Phellopilus nigrolimitatus]|nr:hypothetical protein DFH11DRAFT_1632325 [Phellopilus nigrolimitatus]